MTIHVTPIPRLTNLVAPAFTLGTANAAGSAITAVASDWTLLVYDTTVPTTITGTSADTAATGSAVVSARRDHQHGSSTFTTDISVKVRNDAAQEIADDTTTELAFNTTVFKTVDAMHDDASDNERLIAPSDGKYLVVGQVEWQDSTAGSRWMQIVNQAGATQSTVGGPTVNATSVSMGQTIAVLIDMDEDEWVRLLVRQNSGGTLDTGSARTMFSMMKIASPQ